MGVLRCKEIAEQRRGPTTDGNGSLVRRYVRVFQVVTDGYKVGGLEALVLGAGIPKMDAQYDTRPQGGYEFDGGSAVVGYDAYQPDADAPDLWRVVVNYSSLGLDPAKVSQGQGANPDQQGGGGLNENPLLKPVKVSFRSQNGRKTLYRSYGHTASDGLGGEFFVDDQTAFVNSAYQAYTPGPEVPEAVKVLTIVRNEAQYDAVAVADFEVHVNESDWDILGLTLPAGSARCDSIDAESAYENKLAFFVVTYTFSVKVFNEGVGQSWDWKPTDQGSYYRADNGDKVRPTDTAGNIIFPVLLDGNGRQLEDGDAPVFQSYRIYPRANFNDLNLPT